VTGRWGALALVTIAHGLGSLAVLAVAPLSPFLLDALDLSRVQIGLLLPAVYLGGVTMSIPAGWLTERLGVRRPLALGQLLAAMAVFLAAATNHLSVLLALLVIGGLGFSVLNPATGKAIIEWFPPRQRGLAMGVKQAGLTLGGVASAIALPPIASTLGWRVALAVAGSTALVSAALVAIFYRRPVADTPAAAVAGPRLRELGRFARRPGVAVVFGCGLVLSMAQASVLAYLVLFVRETFAAPAVTAARFLALAQVGGVVGRLGWGAVSDRFFGGRRRPGLAIGAVLTTVTFGLFALGERVPLGLVAPLALAAGAGAFGWVGLYFALVAEIGGPRHAGLLTGLATVFAWGGVLIGPPLFGLLLEATQTYTWSWLALGLITLAVALVLPRLRPLVDRG
jgi:MFS transporter, ACS family, aldohexuronate transporter